MTIQTDGCSSASPFNRQTDLGIESIRSGDVLELKRDIAVKQCAQKLAGPRVGQLAVGIELLVRVCHQHFGSEKNVGIGANT